MDGALGSFVERLEGLVSWWASMAIWCDWFSDWVFGCTSHSNTTANYVKLRMI